MTTGKTIALNIKQYQTMKSPTAALLHLFFSEMGKPWKTHLKDLPNAAAFAAKAARQNQGAEKWKR